MSRRKILVVDANPDMRSAMADAIRDRLRGVSIVEAGDGAAALDRLAEGGVLVVVTSLDLDRLNGAELVRAARTLDYAAQFVVFTGDAHAPLHVDGARVFRKPDDVGELIGHVERLLARAA